MKILTISVLIFTVAFGVMVFKKSILDEYQQNISESSEMSKTMKSLDSVESGSILVFDNGHDIRYMCVVNKKSWRGENDLCLSYGLDITLQHKHKAMLATKITRIVPKDSKDYAEFAGKFLMQTKD